MSDIKDIKDLELESHFRFQQKSWGIQRFAWVLFLLLLIAGAAGLFGGLGPLAYASAGDEQGPLYINYLRFTQYFTPINLQIKARPPDDGSDTLRLWIDRQYLDAFTFQSITPEPERIESTSDRLIYEFPLTAGAEGMIAITLNFRPTQIGQINGRVGLEGGPTLEFSQFNYP